MKGVYSLQSSVSPMSFVEAVISGILIFHIQLSFLTSVI